MATDRSRFDLLRCPTSKAIIELPIESKHSSPRRGSYRSINLSLHNIKYVGRIDTSKAVLDKLCLEYKLKVAIKWILETLN